MKAMFRYLSLFAILMLFIFLSHTKYSKCDAVIQKSVVSLTKFLKVLYFFVIVHKAQFSDLKSNWDLFLVLI